jgi:hypothetical protein
LGGRARWRGTRDRRPFAHACRGDVDRSNSPALVSIGSQKGGTMLAIAGTGYGLIGLLVIILLIVLIVYFARRA